ncbi:FMRFamide receptor-like [Macrobrachium nipponense]|uniref:FMRFamide receptor-like n=1 Tax=Macrobrachium nipponense TaxID=159736 RepID=UPI0030C83EA8
MTMGDGLNAAFQLNASAAGRESQSVFFSDENASDPFPTNSTGIDVDDPCNQILSDSEGSSYSADVFQFVVYGILLTTVGLLGLAGNIISITILSSTKMRSSINCCLIGLTSFDMIVTVTSILMLALPEVSEYTGTMTWYTKGLFQKSMPFVYPLGMIAQTGSIYLTVTVTVERYVAVCLPFKARTLCTYGRARMYVVAVALFSVVYNLPRFWEVTYKVCHQADTGDETVIVAASALRSNPHYKEVYIMWMYLVVMYLVPFLSLLIFNSFIYGKVRAANLEFQRLSSLQRNEIGLAVMLLVVVSVFFVCNVLAFVINILEISDIMIKELIITSNLLVTINSSVNFIIYCTFGQKFRKVFLRMFCSRLAPPSLVRSGTSHYGESSRNGGGGGGGGGGGFTETIRLTSWSDHRHNQLLNPHDARRASYNHFAPISEAGYCKRDSSFSSYDRIQCFN